MQIPEYQIQNVLNAYARRLRRQTDAQQAAEPALNAPDDARLYASEGKRQAIIETVSAKALARITQLGSEAGDVSPDDKAPDSAAVRSEDPTVFAFNVVTAAKTKSRRSIAVDQFKSAAPGKPRGQES